MLPTNNRLRHIVHLFREALLLLCAGAAFLYYGVCVSYAHAGVSWLWLWPLLGLFCLIRAAMVHFYIRIPAPVRTMYFMVMGMALLLFILVEARIASAMYTEPVNGLDYIITLGAAVRNSQPTVPLTQRINTSADYLIENPETMEIASGGQGRGEDLPESECIARELISRGIGRERILQENRSSNTEENLRYSLELIPSGASVGIVTNSFHLYRALRTAELLGCEAHGIPAPTAPVLGLHYVVREFFAVVQLESRALFHQF